MTREKKDGLFKFDYERMIRFSGKIDEDVAVDVLIKSEQFEARDNNKPVQLVINSKGGEPLSALSLYDGMRAFSFPIITVAQGMVASSAIIVFLLGEERCACLNSSFIIHKPKGLARGYFTHEEMFLMAEDIRRTEERFVEIISSVTEQNVEKVREELCRGRTFNAKEALEYGLVHRII